MSTSISDTSFASKVVVVTGAGRGLGRSHAIEFARRGARVIVNDLGGAVDGTGSGTTAQTVVDEIRKFGGEAYANTDSVTTPEGAAAIIHTAVKNCGRVDILVNNAGILRDKTFTNVTIENFREVLDVHLMGSVLVTKAAWPIMRENNWGRVVFTSSGSGIFGHFGQSNYASAKMGLIGLMNVLALEGASKGIKVNTLAPGAITRMTESLHDTSRRGRPEQVSPAVLYLCSEQAPQGVILQAADGRFSRIRLDVGEAVDLGPDVTFEDLLSIRHKLGLD
jgi:NAD(P)-dependent dehydrogenase (short-subunit alcohol dehydrogenase family)|tara:strand:- start:2353 stop:3189 length:837 start_codon:yes stop_codon:yes gene_type:complete